jgi:glycosyltransferase involved in cell wall biosynthesis
MENVLEQRKTDQVSQRHSVLQMVSVVVPGHNAVSTLRLSLPSIRSQDWLRDRLELIYVDDASTDESLAVASKWANRTVSLNGSPHGPSAARNAGVREASGEISDGQRASRHRETRTRT